MSKVTRRRYTPEFKAEAVALVEKQGYKISEAARALGIDRKQLDRWLAKARAQPASGPSVRHHRRDGGIGKPLRALRAAAHPG